MTDIPIFLINLDRSPDRLAFMTSQANSIGFNFERLKGVEGCAVPEWLANDFEGATTITAGQIGCYASHLVAAKTIVDRNLPYAVILEDDATLSPDFLECAANAPKAINGPWDYIHLSAKPKRSVISVAPVKNRLLVRFTYLPFNLAAYVLSNSGARKMLAPGPRTRPVDIDVWYGWERNLVIYGVHPAPAKQMNNFGSTMIHQVVDNPGSGVLSLKTQILSALWTIKEVGLPAFTAGKLSDAAASLRKRFGLSRQTPIINSRSVARSVLGSRNTEAEAPALPEPS
ncbi:MAG: glycosyltransferase family 25 protein [Proteobacteria bacterium]|nr:glycosyltransferase family 25 protein [Pseudomonadota bacterium]